MAMGDIYEVTDLQRMYNQTIVNVYYYEQSAAVVGQIVTSAQLCAEAFNEEFLPVVKLAQSNDLVHTGIAVRNLFDEADKFTLAVSVAGSSGGVDPTDSFPSFVTVPFTLPSQNGAVRDGKKRLAGFGDLYATDGVIDNAAMLIVLQSVADAMELAITPASLTGISDLFVPIIVGRVRTGTAGNYQYRLPVTQAEKVIGLVGEALFNVILGHQISRTIGRGV